MRTVGVEHGFTRMVRIGTDKNPWTSVEKTLRKFYQKGLKPLAKTTRMPRHTWTRPPEA